ncbi:MAG: Porphobilinogen deaminase [uncultured Rubrobacteraceae bacterium]|uniref:Porphobilinogen deaminase n=1 Tax=uncultured Rubrobacteraceae bacterium TaxID=349277 RepID=A0A6J4RC73_9ACTN|nr:MAG: Porphobilinogen deaminase [uncultured Rubrobacteraceae bacterium]
MSRQGPVVLGTRGSKLALVQANACAESLRATGLGVEIRIIKTTSEQQPETPLRVIDRRDVFTRQLDEALLAGEIDLAVHSLKDVPTEPPEGIVLAAVSERHDPSDALVSDGGYDVDGLPRGAVVATSSVRRRSQLLNRRPDLEIVEIRGNVDTRVRKMRSGAADALVLARAGLQRLGLDAEVPHAVLGPETMLPAVGQGALAVATLADHELRGEIRAALNHGPSEVAALTERALLNELEGGCRVPVGALALVSGGEIRLQGLVASPDGALLYRDEAKGGEPEEVGRRLARELLGRGAGVILDEIREVRS